jgi:hypothetical protein
MCFMVKKYRGAAQPLFRKAGAARFELARNSKQKTTPTLVWQALAAMQSGVKEVQARGGARAWKGSGGAARSGCAAGDATRWPSGGASGKLLSATAAPPWCSWSSSWQSAGL